MIPNREPRSDTFARARVHTIKGNWVTLRGSVLGDGPDSSVAVLIEGSHPVELAPLIADAYGLTDRERRVTELVAKAFQPTTSVSDSTCPLTPSKTT